tara:strand:- start:2967 stop:3779 length:813 start_codon:yes stop_codon:yes gene_type:complete
MLDNVISAVIEIILYLLLGSISGILAGLFGIGGGIVIIPALFYIFGYLEISSLIIAHLVLGTSLGVIVFSSISSSLAHSRNLNVQWDLIKIVVPGIIIGSALGGVTASYLESETLKNLVSLFLIATALQMMFQFPPPDASPNTNKVGPVLVGGFIGWLSGVFGIGGGIFSVPYFFHRGLGMKKSIGTSAVCGFPIAMAGSVSYMIVGFQDMELPEYTIGFVYLPAACVIGLVSMITAPIGANIAIGINQKALRRTFSLLIIIMALNLLLR